ncbi:hypothetical protein RCL1_006403 [Eukaryota sp. TZLM3-RCL]
MQTIDQGIVLSFKCYYKKHIVDRDLLEKMGTEALSPLSLADVVKWMSQSWAAVEPRIIENCWQKARLYSKISIEQNQRDVETHQGYYYHQGIELSDLMIAVSGELSREAIFEWILYDEAKEQEEEETEYTVETCVNRAFANVGLSSHNFQVNTLEVSSSWDVLETFLFTNFRNILYSNCFISNVINQLEVSLLTPDGQNDRLETALNNAVKVKQYLVQQYGFSAPLRLRLSEIRPLFDEELRNEN